MEQEQFEKLNDKMLGIITLLSFIDSKLGMIIDKIPKSSPYESVVAQNHYEPINWADND